MARNSATTALSLILLSIVASSQAFGIEKLVNGLQHVTKRVKRTTDKQFVCVLPINITANNPYISCGILNETQSEYPMPVDLSDLYRPRFELASLCSNLTLVEDEEEDENEDSGSSNSDENSNEEEDSEEDDEDLCMREPYNDCAVQCVYRMSGLLNEVGLPKPDALYEHVLVLLNRDGEFRKPIKEAVKICHKQMMDTVHKYGMERLNQCLLLEIVDECLDFQIGLRCPKHNRFPFKKS